MSRIYTVRNNVNWYRNDGSQPVHDQKHPVTKKYWNQFTGQWCSKKSKRKVVEKGSIYYYQFKSYSIGDIEKDFGIKWTEQVATFITKQFFKQFSGYKVSDWEYVYWGYHELQVYLGIDWQIRVNKLVDLGILKVDIGKSRYNTNNRCTYIKLNKRFIKESFDDLVKVYVKSARYQNSIKHYYRTFYKDRSVILKSIECTLDITQIRFGSVTEMHQLIWENRLKRDRSALQNEYLTNKDKIRISKQFEDLDRYKEDYYDGLNRYNFYVRQVLDLEDMDVKRSFYSLQKSNFGGRISHFLSNAPKLYRSKLLIDGQPVVEIDIKATQPSFLYVLFKRWYYSSHKYLADTSHSYENSFEMVKGSKIDIYQYMILKLYGLKHINSDIKRVEVKTLFYRLVFGSPVSKIGGVSKKELCAKMFGYDFYEFLLNLSKGRLDWDIDKRYKNLSALLQREESNFMYAVMSVLEQMSIAFIPIYDSLIVKKTDEPAVRGVFERIIEDKKLIRVIDIN
jgi:hypothetical protein